MVLEPTKGMNSRQSWETIKALAEANGALIVSNLAVPNYAWTITALLASGVTAMTLYKTGQERHRTYEELYLHDNTLTVISGTPACNAPLVSRLKAHWAKAEVHTHNSFGSEMEEPQLILKSGAQKLRIGQFLADDDLLPAARYINNALKKYNGPDFLVS